MAGEGAFDVFVGATGFCSSDGFSVARSCGKFWSFAGEGVV